MGGNNQEMKYRVKKAKRKSVDLKKNLIDKLSRLWPVFMTNTSHV